MQSTYAQKNETAQKASANKTESVIDSSSQSATLQRHASITNTAAQRAPEPRLNLTGMPDNLKSGIESLSGFSMDDVRVHYNSDKPATVQALAYTQGTDIHVAPGQEHALPHEAWHVAQQMAGRVTPTTNIGGMPVNDNAGLEHEADVMGEKAVQCKRERENESFCNEISTCGSVVQCLTRQQRDLLGRDKYKLTNSFKQKHIMLQATSQEQRDRLYARQTGNFLGARANKSSVIRDKDSEQIENLAWTQLQNCSASATNSDEYGPQITVSIKNLDVQTMSISGKTSVDKIFITGAWKSNVVEGNHLSIDGPMPLNDDYVEPCLVKPISAKKGKRKGLH